MLRRSARLCVASVVLAATLSACGGPDGDGASSGMDPQGRRSIEVTTPTGAPEEEFNVVDSDKRTSTEIYGENVDDPSMEVSYKWQGTSQAPTGGTVIIVAVTNRSEVPMPIDALGKPSLKYSSGGSNRQDASALDAAASGVDVIGLDIPLAPGATVNAKYVYDVSMGNLSNAEFTVGNITFEGNLNN